MSCKKVSLPLQLREATADLHRRVEASVGLEGRVTTLPDYRDLLGRLLGLHEVYEATLAGVPWSGLERSLDLPGRRKGAWLRTDLVALGASEGEISRVPRLSPAPLVPDAAAGLGVLYVLEGSTLGGKFILRDVSARFGLSATRGARFFAGYGSRTGAMWRAMVAALEAIDPHSGTARRVEAAACETFERFEAWLREPVA